MKKGFLAAGIAVVALFGIGLAWPSNKSNNDKPAVVSSLADAHGLAVDRQDSSRVYIATHTGLLVMINDGEFQRVGIALDDYMGFSAHPNDPKTFYASGHPSRGGNLGFQKSTDGGKSWQKLANGVNGPVDFHAMAVSQADPNLIYGVYRGQLQRSNDEGKNWELVNASVGNIIALTTNTKTKDLVYAGSADGLYVSQNQGNTWSKLSAINDAVITIAVNPTSSQEIVAYVHNQGLLRTTDAGQNWSIISGYTGGMVMHLAYDIQKPTTIYLINQSLEVHKTTDGGQTWTKVR